jgi:flagellar basal-body rod protein FlgB
MFGKGFFGETIELLHMGLDAASLRQKVISNNIANVDTPGFKRSVVVFESEMRDAMRRRGRKRLKAKRTHPLHIPFKEERIEIRPYMIIEEDTIYRNDKNNVDIDQEMTALTKNSILYEAIATRLDGKFRVLRNAMRPPGR